MVTGAKKAREHNPVGDASSDPSYISLYVTSVYLVAPLNEDWYLASVDLIHVVKRK